MSASCCPPRGASGILQTTDTHHGRGKLLCNTRKGALEKTRAGSRQGSVATERVKCRGCLFRYGATRSVCPGSRRKLQGALSRRSLMQRSSFAFFSWHFFGIDATISTRTRSRTTLSAGSPFSALRLGENESLRCTWLRTSAKTAPDAMDCRGGGRQAALGGARQKNGTQPSELLYEKRGLIYCSKKTCFQKRCGKRNEPVAFGGESWTSRPDNTDLAEAPRK